MIQQKLGSLKIGGMIGAVLLLIAFLLVSWWRTPPMVEYDNLRYVQLLRTAVSSRNADYVQKVEQAVDQQVEAGQMTIAERQHFGKIIKIAEAGDWDQADRMSFEFEAAQLGRRR